MYTNKDKIQNFILFNLIYAMISTAICVYIGRGINTVLLYMLIGFIAICFGALAKVAEDSQRQIACLFFLMCALGILFFIFAFRNETALDDQSYHEMFNRINSIGVWKYIVNYKAEPLYVEC